jgi:hypothetical protein
MFALSRTTARAQKEEESRRRLDWHHPPDLSVERARVGAGRFQAIRGDAADFAESARGLFGRRQHSGTQADARGQEHGCQLRHWPKRGSSNRFSRASARLKFLIGPIRQHHRFHILQSSVDEPTPIVWVLKRTRPHEDLSVRLLLGGGGRRHHGRVRGTGRDTQAQPPPRASKLLL